MTTTTDKEVHGTMTKRYVPRAIHFVTDEQLHAALRSHTLNTRAVFRQARLTRRVKDIAAVTGLTSAEVRDITRVRLEGEAAQFMLDRFEERSTDKASLDAALAAARAAGWSLPQIAEALGTTRQYLHALNPSGDVPRTPVEFVFDAPMKFSDPGRVPAYALSNPDDADRQLRRFTSIPDDEVVVLSSLLDEIVKLKERRLPPSFTVGDERAALERRAVAEAKKLADRYQVKYSTLSLACGRSAYLLPRIMAHNGYPEALPPSLTRTLAAH